MSEGKPGFDRRQIGSTAVAAQWAAPDIRTVKVEGHVRHVLNEHWHDVSSTWAVAFDLAKMERPRQ